MSWETLQDWGDYTACIIVKNVSLSLTASFSSVLKLNMA